MFEPSKIGQYGFNPTVTVWITAPLELSFKSVPATSSVTQTLTPSKRVREGSIVYSRISSRISPQSGPTQGATGREGQAPPLRHGETVSSCAARSDAKGAFAAAGVSERRRAARRCAQRVQTSRNGGATVVSRVGLEPTEPDPKRPKRLISSPRFPQF